MKVSDLSLFNAEKVADVQRRARMAQQMTHYPHELPQGYVTADDVGQFWDGLHPMDQAALATSPIPVLGDIAGLMADARMYVQEPEQRTLGNFALSAAGMIPFVPGALGAITKNIDEYGIAHRPMTIDGGAAPLYDLTQAMPDDVYGPNALQYYGSGMAGEDKILKILRTVRDRPDDMVTIYRGVPDDVDAINPGDWVTLLPEYASEYGRVISRQVPARDVTAWGDALGENGYYPR